MRQLALGLAIVAGSSTAALAQESDLLIEMTAPEQADADSDVAFTLSVTNGGPDDASNPTLDDPLPAGLTFVSLASPGGWTCTTPAVGSGGSVQCSAATLGVALPASFTLTVHVDAAAADGTFFSNIASVANDNLDPTSENDAATAVVHTALPPLADLAITVQGPERVNADVDVTYRLELLNAGSEAATHVAFGAALPGNLSFVSLTQSAGPAFSCITHPVACSIASLPGGALSVFEIVAHVPPATGDGTTYQLMATVMSDHDPNNENDESPTSCCVQADHCDAGACNNHVAVVCPAADACHDQGACNPADGTCAANTPRTGGACDDGDACTQTDTCQAGVCAGGDPVVCPSAGQCEDQGACDPGTGQCALNTPKADGSGCDDGDACTDGDVCTAGSCSGSAVSCDDANGCTTDSCDPSSGCRHAGACVDSGTPDAGGTDVDEVDAGANDAGANDASASDPGASDAGEPMAGRGGERDASARDAGGREPRGDGGARDAGRAGSDAGAESVLVNDCDCRAGAGAARGARSTRALAAMLLAAAAALRLGRRRRPRR